MFLTSKKLSAKHGFFTRIGGVSQGDYASLNCGFGSGEDRELVEQNRKIVLDKIGGKILVTAKQTHSDIAIVVSGEGQYEGDAIITKTPGIADAVLAADCCPILLQDKSAGIIAAVHAGWRGARFGVIGSAIRTMQNLGATDISAVIGPCIQQKSYEVGDEFVSVFASESAGNGQFFLHSNRVGHYMFDLPGYIAEKLRKNGVQNIDDLGEDTLTQPEKFYSYRRATLDGKKEYGRQISVICL